MTSLHKKFFASSLLVAGLATLAACQHPADARVRLGPSPNEQAQAAATVLGVEDSPNFHAVRAALGQAVEGFYEPQPITAKATASGNASSLDINTPTARALHDELRARMRQGGSSR